jgi:hypothetical protein
MRDKLGQQLINHRLSEGLSYLDAHQGTYSLRSKINATTKWRILRGILNALAVFTQTHSALS